MNENNLNRQHKQEINYEYLLHSDLIQELIDELSEDLDE